MPKIHVFSNRQESTVFTPPSTENHCPHPNQAQCPQPLRRKSRRAFQAVVRILDDEASAETGDFAGQAGKTHGVQHLVEILVGRRGFVFRIGAAVGQYVLEREVIGREDALRTFAMHPAFLISHDLAARNVVADEIHQLALGAGNDLLERFCENLRN